jgi:hypothetical protein
MKRLIALLVLALLAAGVVLALRTLPWWAIVVGLVALALLAKLLLPRLLRKLFLAPFRAKGAVLKGATATIHEVVVTEAPVKKPSTEEADANGSTPQDSDGDEDGAEKSGEPRLHYLLEVTITPGQTESPFGMWEPGEIMLVRPESVLRPESDEADDDDDSCEVGTIHYQEDGTWKNDDGMKFPGPQRLKMQLAVKPGARQLKFRYYFEEFGLVQLP